LGTSEKADAQVDVPTKSAEQDEEKFIGNLGGQGVGREAGHDDVGSNLSEQVIDPWEVHFDPGEKSNPKVCCMLDSS